MSPLQAAESWIKRGFHPVPVPYREKGPVLDEWQKIRINKDTVHSYFDLAPQNVGVLLGDENRVADIDCDCLEAVSAAIELAPPTGMIFGRASKPASHYFYRAKSPMRSRKFIDPTNRKITLVELRSQKSGGSVGLQTVVPPSVHESGEPIRFESGRDGAPTEVDPDLLMSSVTKIAAASLLARHWPKEGSRHDAFLALAGILSRAGLSLSDAILFHRALYRALWPTDADTYACAKEVESTFEKQKQSAETTGFQTLSGLVEKKVLQTALGWIDISVSAPAAHITEWPEIVPFLSRTVTPFTADLFPGFLGPMVEAVSRATETPIELAGMLGLAVASACCAKKVVVCPEPGYIEPVNIYTAVGMESGNRKTAVLHRMSKPLMDWEHSEAEQLAPEVSRVLSGRKTQQARIDLLRKKAAKAPVNSALDIEISQLEASLPAVPVLPRLWVQDVTPEQLAVVMAQQGERIALLSDEGGIFDLLAGRYNGGVPNLDVFLQAHSGASVRVDRGSRSPLLMRCPALTVGISPQPQVLQNLAQQPGFRGRGLLARFLYALPTSLLGHRALRAYPVSAHVEDDYVAGILRLLRLEPSINYQGEPTPWRLELSPSAYRCWKDFQRGTEALMKEGGKLYQIRDWGSKLPGAAARLAGILHCVSSSGDELLPTIEVSVTERALNIAAALIDHTLAVFDLMQRDPVIEDATRILRWIQRQDTSTFSCRDCFRAHQAHFRKVDAMQPSISLLEQHGYIRLLPKAQTGHRPSNVYSVHPKLPELGG